MASAVPYKWPQHFHFIMHTTVPPLDATQHNTTYILQHH